MRIPREIALDAVRLERVRQEHLKQQARFQHTLADDLDEGLKLACLQEEMGEVATNVLRRKGEVIDGTEDDNELYKELSQVAALSIAWMESLIR